MVRIHTVSIKKMKAKGISIVVFIGFIGIVLFISKLIFNNDEKINFNFTNETQNIPQYIEDQSFDSQVYKRLLEETIPYVDEYSNNGHTSSNNFITNVIAFITGIQWNQLNTVFNQTIPFIEYVQRHSTQFTQDIIELEGTFQDYQLGDEVTNQNDEDFYQVDDGFAEPFEDPFSTTQVEYTEAQLKNIDFLQRSLYNFEGNLKLTYEDIPVVSLMSRNMFINKEPSKPQILIFHTHSQENFIDSDPKKLDQGVVGLGETLAKMLHERYGIGVLHHKGQYDVVNGKLMRDGSYERVEPAIRQILQQNPSIEILIDLHRDGIESGKLVTTVNGKPTAKIMFVNGICKIMKDGKLTDVSSLPNPFIKDNLAFSLQMQLKANELYPGLMRKVYIKPYRYSLNMLPKSLLIEVGANTNTFEEANNAMEPLAKILSEVLNVHE